MNQEIVDNTINHYVSLLKIKKSNACENKELDNEIYITKTKLETYGVNVEKFDYIMNN